MEPLLPEPARRAALLLPMVAGIGLDALVPAVPVCANLRLARQHLGAAPQVRPPGAVLSRGW